MTSASSRNGSSRARVWVDTQLGRSLLVRQGCGQEPSVQQTLTHDLNLSDDPRVTIGVPFIGMPDYQKLLARRAQNNYVPNAPPTVPGSLRALIQRTDPAARGGHDAFDPRLNPFWGKKILICSGAEDKLVKWEYNDEFVKGLVVEEPSGPRGEMNGLRIFREEGTGHWVSEKMVTEAGQWIWGWGVAS